MFAPTQVLFNDDDDNDDNDDDDDYDYARDNNLMSSVAACDHQVKMMPLGIDNLVLIDDEVVIDDDDDDDDDTENLIIC